jgi:hypothetical protein
LPAPGKKKTNPHYTSWDDQIWNVFFIYWAGIPARVRTVRGLKSTGRFTLRTDESIWHSLLTIPGWVAVLDWGSVHSGKSTCPAWKRQQVGIMINLKYNNNLKKQTKK